MDLAIILKEHIEQYIEKYHSIYCDDKKKTVFDIINCRTSVMGGEVYFCKHCDTNHYVYHSCKNRHCPKCGKDDSAIWLEQQLEKLLPVKYFLVTFTLPEELRFICSVNKKLFYNALFYASSESLKVLLSDPKYAGGISGFTGVLHTWTRKMLYHPHVHYIVPGGAYDKDNNIWNNVKSKFLVQVLALSKIFRAKFRDYIEANNKEVFLLIDSKIWIKKNFVTHSKYVGKGDSALKYLSQYVYKTAISNTRILSCENNKVKFSYINSESKKYEVITLDLVEFIRRFLDHVLPKRFKKVRHYGFNSPKAKELFNSIKKILPSKEKKIKYEEKEINNFFTIDKTICPHCNNKMIWMGKIDRRARSPSKYKKSIIS